MPTVKVPLFSNVYRGVNKEELSDLNYELIDGYVDELGFTNRRPGLVEVLDLGLGANKPIDALFWWPQKGVALAVCDNKIWKIESISGTLSGTNITTNGPGTAQNPVFAIGVDSNVTAPVIYGLIAAGGAIIEGHGSGSTISSFTTLTDAQAPTAVTGLGFVDGYVLATIDGKSFFQIANVNDPTSWEAADFASAMRNPDNIVTMQVLKRQPIFLGDVSCEIWENDGESPFAPVEGGFYETGIIARASACKSEDSLFWLDNTRHFVQLQSGSIEKISTPFDDEIQNFSAVADCIGYRLEIRGKPFLVFQFPTEERTLVYNITKKDWGEWRYYDAAVGQYRHFLGKSCVYAPDWGLNLIGSRTESVIYSMTPDAKADDGAPIRLRKVTGHLNYGTTLRKRSKVLRIIAKRGEGYNGADAKLLVRWNDDNRGWSYEREISLGNIGETETVISVDSRGIYRTRQYEFVVTDPVAVTFGDAEEDIKVLTR